MIVLLDMDGVLADFDQHLVDLTPDIPWPSAEERRKHRFITNSLPQDEFGFGKSGHRKVRQVIEADGFFYDLSVIEGAREGVARILERNHEVWVCSKPLEASDSCPSDKFRWIKDHFPELYGRVILAPDKTLVHGDVLIDDAIKHPLAGSWLPVHYAYPHNADAEGLHWDWSRDFEIVEEYANVNGRHGGLGYDFVEIDT